MQTAIELLGVKVIKAPIIFVLLQERQTSRRASQPLYGQVSILTHLPPLYPLFGRVQEQMSAGSFRRRCRVWIKLEMSR